MLSGVSKDIGEPSLRIDVVQAGDLDHWVEDGRALSAVINQQNSQAFRPS